MNAPYEWHEHIHIVNDFDPTRGANLLLPAGIECPEHFTEADFARLFPNGAQIRRTNFFGIDCGYVVMPTDVTACVCKGERRRFGDGTCAACGGSGYVQATAQDDEQGGAE